jgi:Rieske Fe-S protein
VDPHAGEDRPHTPPPSLWPVGFAVGIVCILAGLIVSPPAVIAGVVLTLVFGFLWARDVAGGYGAPPAPEPAAEAAPAAPAIPADRGPAAMPPTEPEELGERYPRSRFLEFATLGLGATVGGLVTVPALGLAVLPAFTGKEGIEVDLGPLDNFPEGEWRIATFLLDPGQGEVSRRTAYVRNNGAANGRPSFTIVSNRCVHLGCPVQPNGQVLDEEEKTLNNRQGALVRLIPTQPTGFGCPCHGGQYDLEGNRTAGPPVRAMDRYEFSIRNGRLVLGETFSVSDVEGSGARARMKRYDLANPGVHIDGLEAWLYPVEATDF